MAVRQINLDGDELCGGNLRPGGKEEYGKVGGEILEVGTGGGWGDTAAYDKGGAAKRKDRGRAGKRA